MNCNEARRWMSPYLDSELGATKTFEVSEHVRTCTTCAARFEAEQRVDGVIRASLSRDLMPNDLWASVSRAVSTPAWLRVAQTRRYWALAACLLLAATGVVTLRPSSRIQHAPRFVQQFVAETPKNRPFSVVGSGLGLDAMNSFLRESVALVFSGAPQLTAMGHTGLQVVSTIQRTDAVGREYVEVRLNCCGEPMLLLLAKSINGDWPTELELLAEFRPGASPRSFAGVEVGIRDIGDVRIVAASRHGVQDVLAGLSRWSA